MAAVAYGLAILAAGMLAASAVRDRQRARAIRLAGGREISVARTAVRPRAGWIADRARARGWRYGPSAYVAALVSVSATCGGIGWTLLGPVGAAIGGFGGPSLLEWILGRRAGRAGELMEGQLREAVVALASAVRAGHSIRRALHEAAAEVDDPLRPHLVAVVRRLEVGEPLDAALAALRDIGVPDARLLVTLLEVHGRTGGDLPAMLDEIAEIIGQRADARRTIRALTAQGRASGAVLTVLPIAFVTLLSWTGGDGLGAYYRTAQGSALLSAGLLCDALGFLWIRRILRPRWLR
jgi:tight adherence protein B